MRLTRVTLLFRRRRRMTRAIWSRSLTLMVNNKAAISGLASGCSIFSILLPTSPMLAPAYAAAEGLFLGGMFRDDPDALPSTLTGRAAPDVTVTALPGAVSGVSFDSVVVVLSPIPDSYSIRRRPRSLPPSASTLDPSLRQAACADMLHCARPRRR